MLFRLCQERRWVECDISDHSSKNDALQPAFTLVLILLAKHEKPNSIFIISEPGCSEQQGHNQEMWA